MKNRNILFDLQVIHQLNKQWRDTEWCIKIDLLQELTEEKGAWFKEKEYNFNMNDTLFYDMFNGFAKNKIEEFTQFHCTK